MKLKKRKTSKHGPILLFFLSVLSIVVLFMLFFNHKISPKMTHVAELELNNIIEKVASDYHSLTKDAIDMDDLLILQLNNKGEILTVDYQISKLYEIADQFTNNLMSSIHTINSDMVFKFPMDVEESHGLVFYMPMGMATDYVFLNNLGPKIPVLIRFIDSIFTNVQTKITNYGINNALIELYLEVSIKYEIITPVTMKENRLEYTVLLDAKIINGQVPEWYGGEMITNSKSVSKEVSFPNS